MLERSGLKKQPLAEVVLARVGARQLADITGAMYREFRPEDLEGAKALERVLQRIDELRSERNKLLHAPWTLGVPSSEGKTDAVAWSLTSDKHRTKGRIIQELTYQPEDFDKLTEKATTLQVYASRLCCSINQSNMPLSKHLKRPA